MVLAFANEELQIRTTNCNRPIGDFFEMMPLDCSLFYDMHEAANRHLSLTSLLEKDDRKKSL